MNLNTFLIAGWLLVLPGSTFAAPITREGVTFAEASENVRLLNVTGTGWIDDPFVLVEAVIGDGDVVIEVDVHAIEFGSRVSTFHRVGLAITKVVQNHTGTPWYFFNIELERLFGSGSDYYDGLSFGQEAKVNRPFVSDRFMDVEDQIEPRDVLRFRQGVVAPGDQVSFRFSVTHNGPTPHFYLVQHTRREVSALRPEDGRLDAAPPSDWETP